MHDRNRTFPIFCILAALLVAALPVRPASTAAATPTQPSLAPAPSAPVPPATGSATPPSPATDLATGVASPAPASPAPTAAKASKTMPYTVAKGDSWTKLARKFDSTRKKLKALQPRRHSRQAHPRPGDPGACLEESGGCRHKEEGAPHLPRGPAGAGLRHPRVNVCVVPRARRRRTMIPTQRRPGRSRRRSPSSSLPRRPPPRKPSWRASSRPSPRRRG